MMKPWVSMWVLVGAALAASGCGQKPVEADGGARCTLNSQCPAGKTCVRGDCVEIVTPPGDDGGYDAGFDAGDDAGVDAGFDAGPEDAGPQGNCEDPFDAGLGPFTFDIDAGKPDGSISIQLIQDPDAGPKPANPSNVFLWGVVAVTPRALISGFDGGTCTYGAWVSEPNGGPSSGIGIIDYPFAADGGLEHGPNCPDGGFIPGDLAVGEALSVHGRYSEFCISCGGNYIAEVNVTSLERLGTAPVPPPVVVTASDVGEGVSPKPELNRRLEGTLVQLRDVEVSNINPDAPKFYYNFLVQTAGGSGQDSCFVHNAFDFNYRPKLGHKFKCITGPLTYSFGHWKVQPRTDWDLVRLLP
jgi:hypothetical protein